MVADKKTKYGVLRGNTILGYKSTPFGMFRFPASSFQPDGSRYTMQEVKLLAPCKPSKIVCLGVNYGSHAREFKHDIPSTPLIFLKPSTAVIGPESNIVLPHKGRIDYECELAIVIGKKTTAVTQARARESILGYTCFNDVSDRKSQKEDIQWTRAKGYDTFAPIGPWIETELEADNLLIETYLNDKRVQSSRTSNLIFGIPKLVSFISAIMTLLPGDVIATGTPEGVGPLKNGDTVEIKIENIGTLRNYVIERQY